VNDRLQLAQAEQELRRRTNESLMRSGVTMVDPATTYVDTTVDIGQDVTLFPGAILQGSTRIGDRTEVGSACRLVDTEVGADCVLDKTVADNARIGDGCHVGPYAHLGPGTEIAAGESTGAFFAPTPDPN
jgi:bifunctional UDP-N-acetylglucosamine pyrophosphorylase/glucosamine-1-phosphate N-acetyltransferase